MGTKKKKKKKAKPAGLVSSSDLGLGDGDGLITVPLNLGPLESGGDTGSDDLPVQRSKRAQQGWV